MTTIYKYKLERHMKLPKGAKILTAAIQNGERFLWAEVDAGAQPENRIFQVFGTGSEIPQGMGIDHKYIATIFEGPFVWHVYEYTGI